MPYAVLLAGWLFMQAAPGNVIVVPPAPEPKPSNVSVNVTPPAPDPAALRGATNFAIDSWEFDHASVPVNWANALLKGQNIWTTTPAGWFQNFTVAGMRNSAKFAAMGLFLIGIVWTGVQLIWGNGTGTTSAMQLLPLVVTGFLMAIYGDTIAMRSIDLCNWLNNQLGEISIVDFTGTALTLPEQPDVTAPGAVTVPAGFVSGMLTSLIYAIVLIILELKMFFRLAVLTIGDVVMPISAILWAFQITRGWGVKLFLMFYGWLFGQPLVVVCLALSGSLLTFLNVDPAVVVIVKVAILFAAIKMVSLFASSLGGGGLFGAAGLLFLLRRGQGMFRRGATSATTSTTAPAAQPAVPAAAVQSGRYGGSGQGSAATGRPWRPSYGMA